MTQICSFCACGGSTSKGPMRQVCRLCAHVRFLEGDSSDRGAHVGLCRAHFGKSGVQFGHLGDRPGRLRSHFYPRLKRLHSDRSTEEDFCPHVHF